MERKFVLGTVALLALMVGSAVGADSTREGRVVRSYDLLGISVRSPSGEYLGKIEDIVIDMRDGRVVYFALAHGETVGFGGKMFAIAPEAFGFGDVDKKVLGLDEKKSELDRLAGFDANRWPTMAAIQWGKKRDKEIVKDNEEARKHMRRVSGLVGYRVKNKLNEDLGRVYDLPINTAAFRVAYAAVAYGGVAGIGEKLFAVPWEAMHFESADLKPGDHIFLLHAALDDFKNGSGFDTKAWPSKPDARFHTEKKGSDAKNDSKKK